MSWRSVTNIIAPLVYARAYACGARMHLPAAPFLVAIGFVALAEALLLGVPVVICDDPHV